MTSRLNLAALIIVAGLALLAGSWFWTGIAKSQKPWTAADAKALSEATAALHRLTSEVAPADAQRRNQSNNPAAGPAEGADVAVPDAPVLDRVAPGTGATRDDLEAARARYEKWSEALQEAKTRGQTAADAMRWGGTAAIMLGLMVYLANRPTSA